MEKSRSDPWVSLWKRLHASLFFFSGFCFGGLLLTACGRAVFRYTIPYIGLLCLIAPVFLGKRPALTKVPLSRVVRAFLGAGLLCFGALFYCMRIWGEDQLLRTCLFAVGGLYFCADVLLALPELLPRPASDPATCDRRPSRREKSFAFLFCLLVGYLMVGICSRSSPLYPLNDWVDANCFFTTGKAMFGGKVVYRDIYEQKGILLYFIYGLGYLIDHTGFFGVYLLEGLSFSAFLYLAYLTGRLYAGKLAAAVGVPVVGCLVMASAAVRQGGGAEQFTLPLLLLPLYLFLDASKHGDRDGIPTVGKVFLLGMGAAGALWVKFTLLGVYIGYVLLALILCARDRNGKKLWRSVLAFVGGAAALTLPFALYFLLNGAVKDWFDVYFYNNIFAYTPTNPTEGKLPMILHYTQSALRNNIWGTWACFGLCWLLFGERKRTALGSGLLYAAAAFFTYVGGIGWTYYGLALAWTVVPGVMFACAGAESVLRWLCRHFSVVFPSVNGIAKIAATVCLSLTLLLPTAAICANSAWKTSPNVFYMGYERETIWQQKFADIILSSDEPTVLNYSCLDLGVYTVAGVLPDERFFCRLNIDLDEMEDVLRSAVREKRPHYVVARSQPSQFLLSYYRVIAREDSFLEFEDSEASYYLLERK